MNKVNARPTIFAYGFDAAGFVSPSEPLETEKYVIHFIDHRAVQSLEQADGIITPSGIFENFKQGTGYGEPKKWVECDKDHLARRVKEVFQNFNRGGWTAFLLRKVRTLNGEYKDTDLAKQFLTGFFDRVESNDPDPLVDCKADEFAVYMHDFGISRTTFWFPSGTNKPRVLAVANGGKPVAAELLGQFFFLPLQSVEKNRNVLIALVTLCAEAVLEYKRRNDLYLPGWVEEIEFRSENLLRTEINNFEHQIMQRREELSKLRRYKRILTVSGKMLNVLIVEILRDYFKLDVHTKEEFIEDAIINGDGKPLFVVEIKGVNGGLKRDHVNQVDSHRERLGILPEIPGLLVINDFSDTKGLADRKAKSFDALHVSHAEKLNIKILRTTTLLEIIRTFETEKNRDRRFIELCLNGKPMVELPNAENKSTQPLPNT